MSASPLRSALALALAAAALAAAPRAAPAQQEDAGAEDRPGWLGVGLQETLVCPGSDVEVPEVVTPEDCRRAYVAEAVVEDGPAARAGVHPGDTLVAVNGRPLASRRGARALRSLRPGRPVEVLVGRREGSRESLRVTPAPRPPEMGRLTLRTPLAPEATMRVSPGVVLRWSRALQGVEAPEELARGISRPGLRVDRQGRVYLQGDGELVRLRGVEADRIRALRDSVMREMRERLRQQAPATPEAPALPLEPASGLLRAAGAEFRTLEPRLAGHFEGVDRGLLVLRILPGTPAHELGLRPGDVVVEAAGRPTHRPAQLRAALQRLAHRDSVVVRWIRSGEEASGALRRP